MRCGSCPLTTSEKKSSARVIIETLAGTDKPTFDQISAHYDLAVSIVSALITEGHLPADLCGDCAVAPGQPHQPGCDVARCKLCGWQDIGDHSGDCSEDRPSTIWTGTWPGRAEVEEYKLKDLNELASLAAQGLMKWDVSAERWVK